MAGHWCAGNCQTKIALSMVLCTSCTQALEKYLDENPSVVDAYAAHGMRRLDAMLAHHATFQRWLTEHEGGT